MGYTPDNNPYIPGDPYSYDLKWQVENIKHLQTRFTELDENVQEAADQADRAEQEADRAAGRADFATEEADRATEEANRAVTEGHAEVLKAEGFATGTQEGAPVAPDSPYYQNNSEYFSQQAAGSASEAADYAEHIADPVSGLVASWLEAHIDPDSGYAIDDTLTVALAAADSKTVGDTFAVMPSLKYNIFVTAMESGDDFNDYLTEGSYRVESGTIANTLLNKPINKAGRLFVISPATSNHVMQYYLTYDDIVYHRAYSTGSGTFTAWNSEDTTLAALEGVIISSKYNYYTTAMTTGDDFNDYTSEGSYRVESGTIAGSLLNKPINQAGRLLVISLATSTHKLQLYTAISGYRYWRIYNSSADTFTDWKSDEASIAALEGSIISNKYNYYTTAMTTGDDFNDYLTEGSYRVESGTIANTLLNKPINKAGRLIVISMASNNHKLQIYIDITGVVYKRAYSSGDGFSSWQAENTYKDILTGKKWVACGDSFTAGDFTGDPGEVRFTDQPYQGQYKVYPFYIGRHTLADVVNEAISGSCMAYVDGTHNEFSTPGGRYTQIPADADYITLYFGINDSHQNVPIGTIDDAVNTTFYGAWNIVMQYLISNHPAAKIGIIISNGCDSIDYPNAEKAIAKKYGVAALDINSDYNVPIIFRVNGKPDVDAAVLAANLSYYKVGVGNEHPNTKLHAYEATIIENWLKSI